MINLKVLERDERHARCFKGRFMANSLSIPIMMTNIVDDDTGIIIKYITDITSVRLLEFVL